ncbi:MAG: site-specific integrase [Flavobacteriales bacterium]|nr:site-specific integrase [Flavobacteriales bacterium]
MAHVKLHLDKRYSDNADTYPLVLQVAHKGKTRTIPLDIRLLPKQWNAKAQSVSGIDNYKRLQSRLEATVQKANIYLESNALELRVMNISDIKTELTIAIKRGGNTTADTVQKVRYTQSTEGTLQNWGQLLIGRALATNRVGKASWYRDGIHAFIKFNKGKDITLIEINEQFLEEFKVWAETEIEGVKRLWQPNTTGVYMRAVRAIINQSIKEKRNFVPSDFQPFRIVGIPYETKEVDSISSTDIANLRRLELEQGSDLWKARARFLFMFNCQGMNFVDLAKLLVSDRVGQFISYERTKTIRKRKNKRIDVALTREAASIWEYFTRGKNPHDLAFDIYDVEQVNNGIRAINAKTKSSNTKVTERNRRRRALKKQNSNLEMLAGMAGIGKKITTYDARYGWVNAALDANVSEEIIGKGLGHGHPGITRVYFEERHKKSSLDVRLNELITGN